MKKVFVTTKIPEVGTNLLKQKGYQVVVGCATRNLSTKEIIKKAKGFDALLCQLEDKIDRHVMDALLPNLKVISNYAVGLDNIDEKAAKQRGIVVGNTPGVLTKTVAEHTVGLILAISKRIVEADRFIRAGKYRGFEPDLLVGTELMGKTLGIVGHGRIGCRTAQILQKGFGMRVVYYDIKGQGIHEVCGAKKSSLKELLKVADVVSLHVPLLSSTHHLIGEREFKTMKKTAYLVNTARGAVIDEKALVLALKTNRIKGAALDVFEKEPKLAPGLVKQNNVVLTPHIASASVEARSAMAELAAKNIIVVLENL